MIYSRGNRQDYDEWERMGNSGWSYKNLLKYFKKLENCQVNAVNTSYEYRHKGGPLTISTDFWISPQGEAFIQGGKEYGLPELDYNGPTQVGASKIQSNLKRGVRQSANVAYLYPIRDRKNLHVKKMSHVTKILINEKTKQAQGVEFVHNKKTFYVRATREVIVSAGAINSPQLLMLSGIGPAKHLREMGIRPLKNLAVGYNLMDHIAPGAITYLSNTSFADFDKIMDDFNNNWSAYVKRGSGPISSPGGCETVIFYDTDRPGDPNGYPDIELLQLGGSMTSFPTFQQNFNIEKQLYNNMFGDLHGRSSYMVFPMILRPYSRGRVMLKSKSPFKFPALIPNYLKDRRDVATAIKGIRLLQKIVQTKAMQHVNSQLLHRLIPGCKIYSFDSDAYWECYLRHFTFTSECLIIPLIKFTLII